MNKIIYPKEGLYIYCQVNCDNVENNLVKANSKCTFTIPEGFEYKEYLQNLSNVINQYKSDITEIDEILKLIDKRYEELSDAMDERIKLLEVSKIEYRERAIK